MLPPRAAPQTAPAQLPRTSEFNGRRRRHYNVGLFNSIGDYAHYTDDGPDIQRGGRARARARVDGEVNGKHRRGRSLWAHVSNGQAGR